MVDFEDYLPPNVRSTGAREQMKLEKLDDSALVELKDLLASWRERYYESSNGEIMNTDEILHILRRISNLLEAATTDFLEQSPDPLDDRHPHHTHPNCMLGILLKSLLRDKEFMSMLSNSYLLARDNIPLNEAAARVFVNTVPAIDAKMVFNDPEEFLPQLYKWAQEAPTTTLQAYSFGLLAAAMEVPDIAGANKQQNSVLVPIALHKLKQLKDEMERNKANGVEEEKNQEVWVKSKQKSSLAASNSEEGNSVSDIRVKTNIQSSEGWCSPLRKKRKVQETITLSPVPSRGSQSPSASSSQWHILQNVMIGKHQIYPVTNRMHQRFILQYLAPLGEYQDLVALAYLGNSMSILLDYIRLDYSDDIRLTFDALKYLASLLVHRKIALDFVAAGGVEALLRIPCTSLASVGVSTALYYLAYSNDVMEKVCQLDGAVLDELVEYALWIMEHSHECGMASATMFFTHSLSFRAILNRFDERNGLRVVYNYMSTLSLMQFPQPERMDLTDEQMQTSSQVVRNACACLRSYTKAHTYVRMSELCRPIAPLSTAARNSLPMRIPTFLQDSVPDYKPMQLPPETNRLALSTLALAFRSAGVGWRAMEDMHKFGFLRSLFFVVVKVEKWTQINFAGRTEMVRNVLEVLWAASTLPRVQKELSESTMVWETDQEAEDDDEEESGRESGYKAISILLAAAEGVHCGDPSVQIAAMNVLLTCVGLYGESDKKFRLSGMDSGKKQRNGLKEQVFELQEKVVAEIRRSNGISILVSLLHSRKCPQSADLLRAYTCQLLCSLARFPAVRQILSKLPLIAHNQLHDLMKEPIMAEKKKEHAQFCSEGRSLISIVTEKPLKDVKKDFTQEKLWKSHIVSSTKISYNEKELLQLIHSHLESAGLTAAAAALANEAALPQNSQTASHASTSNSQNTLKCLTPFPSRGLLTDVRGTSTEAAAGVITPQADPLAERSARDAAVLSTPGRQNSKEFPRRLTIQTPSSSRRQPSSAAAAARPSRTLGDIVTEYCRLSSRAEQVQHANCQNPVSTCPPFSLFHPHRCPEPKSSHSLVPNNLASRHLRANTLPKRYDVEVRRANERFVFSKLRSWKTITEHDEQYTACAFSIDDEHIICGMFTGEIHWINVETGVEDATMQCHHSYISDILPSKDGSMLLTSTHLMRPHSTLWRLGESHEHLMDLTEEHKVRFSNYGPDRILGTMYRKATIFDLESASPVWSYVAPLDECYAYAGASFSPDDRLVLHQSSLLDPRLPSPLIHTFDRFNEHNGGVFHPHGNEIIINSEVWDMRNYGLVQSVPALDKCQLIFNSTGNIIIAACRDTKKVPYEEKFNSTLRAFSAIDYSVISSFDNRKHMSSVCIDHSDSALCVVELTKQFSSMEYDFNRGDESLCRIFEIGKERNVDDEEEGEGEEEDEDRDSGGGDSSSSSSSSSESGSSLSQPNQGRGRGGGRLDRDRRRLLRLFDEVVELEDHSSDFDNDSDEDEDERPDDDEGGESQEGEGEGEEDGGSVAAEGEDDDDDSGDLYMGEGSGGEDDEQDDEEYDPARERQGTSSIVLNPNLRKRKRQP